MKRTLILLATVTLIACDTTPQWPAAADGWKPYRNDAIGISLEYPGQCSVEDEGQRVLIRFDGAPIISIAWTTEAGARKNGLWAGHDPIGPVQLGGRAGNLYRYTHHDGPFGMNTTSFVVPHREKLFALEFRTTDEQLGLVALHVLDSFAFTGAAGDGS
jgi:hypothetical protein